MIWTMQISKRPLKREPKQGKTLLLGLHGGGLPWGALLRARQQAQGRPQRVALSPTSANHKLQSCVLPKSTEELSSKNCLYHSKLPG